MRLIDADRINYDIYEDDSGTKFVVIRIDDLSQIPTIEAEPVRHGHWIPVKAMVGIDPVTMDFKIGDADRCSLCSTDFVSVQTKYKYCPFCGAKMDGESEVQE